ncbi:hypothetical protein ACHAXT_011235 [Thalassiosira profunda]
MPQVQGSDCPSDECTRCEEGPVEKQSEEVGDEPPRLPTAEDCAKQLSSIFNSETDVEAPRQNEGANQQCIVQSSKPPAAATTSSGTELQQIGRGGDAFEMHVIVDHCHDLCRFRQSNSGDGSPNKSVWLSYRLFGAVHQSEIFSLTRTDDFAPFLSSFRIRSSPQELAEYFSAKKSGTLRIHLCTEGEVLGTALVDLRPLIAIEDSAGEDIEGRMTHDEYPVIPRDANNVDAVQASGSPRISVRLCLDRRGGVPALNSRKAPHSTAAVYSSTSSQTTKTASVDRSSSPTRKQPTVVDVPGSGEANQPSSLQAQRESGLTTRDAALSKKEKDLYDAAAALQRKQSEWEAWRHKQELEWHEKLREKEAAMMRVVEERVCNLEKERLASVDASKREYERLEARLRKALMEVEAKERKLKDIELGHTNEQKRRLQELDLKERLLKEEVKHSIEIERAKVAAAVDQAVAAQKSAAESNKKVKQVEAEMDQLRVDQRATPEVSLMHQVAELKGQLADGERRIEAIKAEKSQITAEKEQFRSNVHKLARALRHEREKTAKRKGASQEVRLSYDADEKSFVLGGGQDEITRILADLNRLSQAKQGAACQTPVAASTPTRQPLSNIQQQSGGSGMTHGPPLPSPQSRTHSPIIGAPAQPGRTTNGLN